MAINSREKRQSVPGTGRPWMRSHDTTVIDEQWRLGAGNVYNGNALTPPVGGGPSAGSLQLMGMGISFMGLAILIGLFYA